MASLSPRRPHGFSLVELLVVIGILAALIAILIPVLGRARKQAKTAVCGTNLHQLGLATHTYYNEYQVYPPHKWTLPDGTSDRWPTPLARYLRSDNVQICPSVPDWQVGRNNPYGYNYKYLGSLRTNDKSPTRPFERFPVKTIAAPGRTIAYADSDGTGWTKPYQADGKDVESIGNHGYTLDPTFISEYASASVNNEGTVEAYAYLDHRTYISTRHQGGANAAWLDGHVDRITPQQVYQDNRFWNGLGEEDPARDPHVDTRVGTGTFRFADALQ